MQGPHDPAWILPHPEQASPAEREQHIAWQEASVVQSVAYVKGLNAALPA